MHCKGDSDCSHAAHVWKFNNAQMLSVRCSRKPRAMRTHRLVIVHVELANVAKQLDNLLMRGSAVGDSQEVDACIVALTKCPRKYLP